VAQEHARGAKNLRGGQSLQCDEYRSLFWHLFSKRWRQTDPL